MTALLNASIAIQAVISIIPLVVFSIFALWKENAVLFMLTAGVALMTGLYAPNIISGQYATSNIGITFGLSLIMYAFACCGWAFRLMFWRD